MTTSLCLRIAFGAFQKSGLTHFCTHFLALFFFSFHLILHSATRGRAATAAGAGMQASAVVAVL